MDSKRIARYFGYWLASNRDLREFCDCERIRADCSEQLSPALCCTKRHIPPVQATTSRDSRRHRESPSSVSTPRCRRRGWPVEMAAPQPGDDIDTLLFGA